MRRYAERTSVPVSQTRAEIEKLLNRHGATGFGYGATAGNAMLMFEMKSRRLRFIVPMPVAKRAADESRVAAEQRRRWRALLLVLKAKLEAVASLIVTFDEEFLAHIVIDGNSTVGDKLVPTLDDTLKVGHLPPLLGPGAP